MTACQKMESMCKNNEYVGSCCFGKNDPILKFCDVLVYKTSDKLATTEDQEGPYDKSEQGFILFDKRTDFDQEAEHIYQTSGME